MSKHNRKQRKQKNRELKNKEKRQYEASPQASLSPQKRRGNCHVSKRGMRIGLRSVRCCVLTPPPIILSRCSTFLPAIPMGRGLTVISPAGNFAYCNRILAANKSLDLYEGDHPGKVWWTGEVVIPMLKDMHVETHHRR